MKPEGKRAVAQRKTQAKLKTAAAALFESSGYQAVTLREVARAAKVSTGAIFASFSGKAALYEAATGRKAPDVAGFLARVARLAPGDRTRAAILAAEAGVLLRQLGVEP